MKTILRNVEFHNYTGKNPAIQKMIGRTVDVIQDIENQLTVCMDGKQIFTTSPVVDENSFRAFEFESRDYLTRNGTGYGFVKQH